MPFRSCVVIRHDGCRWDPSGVTNELRKHQDFTSKRIAVSVKLPKLDGSCSWKHQEVAMDAGVKWEKSDFKGCYTVYPRVSQVHTKHEFKVFCGEH